MSNPGYIAQAPHDSRLILTPEDHIITPQEMVARTKFKVSPMAMHAVRTLKRSYSMEGITIPGERPEFIEESEYNLGLLLELTIGVYQLCPMRDASAEWDKRLRAGHATATDIWKFFADVYDLLTPFCRESEIKMDLSSVKMVLSSATFTLSMATLEAAEAFQERFKVTSITDPEESPKVTQCRIALILDMGTEIFRFRKVHPQLALMRDRMRASNASIPQILRFFQMDLGLAFNYLPTY